MVADLRSAEMTRPAEVCQDLGRREGCYPGLLRARPEERSRWDRNVKGDQCKKANRDRYTVRGPSRLNRDPGGGRLSLRASGFSRGKSPHWIAGCIARRMTEIHQRLLKKVSARQPPRHPAARH